MRSKIITNYKELDEETLRAMIRTAVKEGSPGDDKIRCVFQVASDETSDIASTRRAFGSPTMTNLSKELLVVAAGLAQALKVGL